MNNKTLKLDEFDVMDLAGYICGLNEDAIEDALQEQFGITLTGFAALMTKLLPMVDIGVSPLSQERFKGFSIALGGDKRQFLLKEKI
jgi:hypothetical protein